MVLQTASLQEGFLFTCIIHVDMFCISAHSDADVSSDCRRGSMCESQSTSTHFKTVEAVAILLQKEMDGTNDESFFTVNQANPDNMCNLPDAPDELLQGAPRK